MTLAAQRWTGFHGAAEDDAALANALDLETLIRAQGARDAAYLAAPNEDWWQYGLASKSMMPLALGAIGLGVLLLLPTPGGRRRR